MRLRLSGPASKANAVHTRELWIATGDQLVTDLTGMITDFCRNLGDGLLNVFVPHATAGIAVIEIGSGSEYDLQATIDRVWPSGETYSHRHGSPGHGRDHVVPAFVAPSVVLPVIGGAVALGTWQSVVLVDSNRDNPERRVRLSFIPG
jgi:secondary thiamine-phosphate synthase enzyme